MNLQLKQLRTMAKLTQPQLAEKAGVNLRTYQSWEREDASISLEGACLIADVLECSLDEIAGREFDAKEWADDRQRVLNTSFSRLDEARKDIAVETLSGWADSICTQDEAAGAAAAQVS
jgi:transcriptional regulator with XRE-family HTH domain